MSDRIATEDFVAARTFYLFSRDADATVEAGGHRWYAERDLTITHVLTSAGTAPVGADLIFDLILDGGTSIYTTTANRPKVVAGTNVGDTPAPDNPTVLQGHYVTVDTIQVGSSTPGSKIDLRIFYQ